MSSHKMLRSILLSVCIFLSGAGAHADAGSNSPSSIFSPTLSPEVRISTPSSPTDFPRYTPAAAYDSIHNQYLVVWVSQYPGHEGIYAQRVSNSGERVGPWFPISTGSNDHGALALAFSATSQEYLVVWVYDSLDDHVHHDIWGRTVAWDGSSMGPERQIFTWPNRSFSRPRVAWDSVHNQFMVISSVWDTQNFWWNDIAAKLVMSDGTTPYDGFQVYQNPAVRPSQGDISYNPVADEYFVVWRELNSSTGEDIYGARVAWNGGITRSAYALANTTDHESAPAIASNHGDAYLLTYQRLDNVESKFSIRFRLLNLSGDPYYSGDPGPAGISMLKSLTAPDVENIPGTNKWLITTVYEADGGSQAWAFILEKGDNVFFLYSSTPVADWPAWTITSPTVAAGSPGFLIAYEGQPTGVPGSIQHIYGRVLNTNSFFLPAVMK
jgi:hypothetical protein